MIAEPDQTQEEILIEKLRGQLGNTKRMLARANRDVDNLQVKNNLLVAVDGVEAKHRKVLWKPPPTHHKRVHHGIANLMLSDLHLDETVLPEQMMGVNAYNRRIAGIRLDATFSKFLYVTRDYVNGIAYDGAHIWANGDTFSGNIHEELKITNDSPGIMESVDYWVDPVVAGLLLVADELGKVGVSVRVGNHGRNTYKPIMKGRVADNFDWLFWRVVYRALKHDKRFTWDMPMSPDGILRQYNTTFLATHGDQFSGGSGISGILTPLTLGEHRKTKRNMAMSIMGDFRYDIMLLGHFHQYMTLPRIIVNGSLKGYDEYAFDRNFGFEVPQQAFWVTTPENGVTFSAPIRPMDVEAEGWQRAA